MKASIFFGIIVVFLLSCAIGGSWNREWVMERAPEKWAKQGFEIVDYEGYQFHYGIPFSGFGGAKVWYELRKVPDNGITYTGALIRWGDEVQVYGPDALDAIRPNSSN